MLNQRRLNFDITLIQRKQNTDEYPSHFNAFFWCDCNEQKIDIFLTYFLQRSFDGSKNVVVPAYIFRHNFDGIKIEAISKYDFRRNFDGRKIDPVLMHFIDAISTCFFWCIFERQKNMFVLISLVRLLWWIIFFRGALVVWSF